MKYAPSLPPPVTGAFDRWEIKSLASAESVKSVQGSPPPPATVKMQAVEQTPTTTLVETERRGEGIEQRGRRLYNRRYIHHSMLLELRSAISRRKTRQRRNDNVDNVDEFA